MKKKKLKFKDQNKTFQWFKDQVINSFNGNYVFSSYNFMLELKTHYDFSNDLVLYIIGLDN